MGNDQAINVDADGDRVIRRPDGTVVTLREGGEVAVARPDGRRITHRSDGVTVVDLANGERIERRPKPPRALRPLNVVSNGPEEVGRLMSNFAATPFTLDGRRYASVEAFYVALKFADDPTMQAKVRRMTGKEAKRAGAKQIATEASYGGARFRLGGPEHHALLARAIRAKLQQNPPLAKAFAATRPRPIVHDTGRAERTSTAFPAEIFVQILTELREGLEPIPRSATPSIDSPPHPKPGRPV